MLAEGEEVPYESELSGALLAYGVAADLYAPEDETGLANVYRQRYEQGKQDIAPVFWDEVEA